MSAVVVKETFAYRGFSAGGLFLGGLLRTKSAEWLYPQQNIKKEGAN